MTTHELAHLLLTLPDLPVATHANNHDWFSRDCGGMTVARTRHYTGEHIQLGNISRRMTNAPNWLVLESYNRDLPNHWHARTPRGGWDLAKGAAPYAGVTVLDEIDRKHMGRFGIVL